MSSTSNSARVETVTAEVRVLMVGSRQVTMSVYSQLDEVWPEAITPFGRVAPRDKQDGWLYVVGSSAAGHLVRSRLPVDAQTYRRWRGEPSVATANKIRDLGENLRRIESQIEDAERREAQLMDGDGYYGAPYREKQAADADAEAADLDAQALAAEAEVERLHLAAKAAEWRHKAARHRHEAQESRAELEQREAELFALRANHDSASQAIQHLQVKHASQLEAENAKAAELPGLVAHWHALPLIVLAGLR